MAALFNDPLIISDTFVAKRGVTYTLSDLLNGNAVMILDDCKISINKGMFVSITKGTSIIPVPNVLYVLDRDVGILELLVVVPIVSVISSSFSTADITLAANIESTDVVTVTDRQGVVVTKGDLVASLSIFADGKASDVTLKLYGDTLGLISTGSVVTVPRNEYLKINIFQDLALTQPIPAAEIFSIRCIATENIIISGTYSPSTLRLERKNV